MALSRPRRGPALAIGVVVVAALLLLGIGPASNTSRLAPGVRAGGGISSSRPIAYPPAGRSGASAPDFAWNVSLSVGSDPDAIAFDGTNGYLYVANSGSDNVSVIDGSTDRVVGSVTVGSDPDSITYDPVSGDLYVANSGSSNVSVLDGATDQVVGSVPVGQVPSATAYDAADGYLYVANYFSDYLTEINTVTNQPVGTIPVALEMDAIAYDGATERVYAASYGLIAMTVLNGVTGQVVGRVGVGINPDAIALDPANGFVYVADFGSDNITVVNGATDRTVASIPAGLLPSAVVANTLNGYLYVTNFASENLTVIDDATEEVVGSLPVGSNPDGVAYDPSNGYVYVANSASDNVTVADPATLPCPPCYAVRFSERGAIPGTPWSVALNGTARNSTTSQVLFTEPDGTYLFTVGAVPGFTGSLTGGMLTVRGANVTEPIVFSSTLPGVVDIIPVGPLPDAIAFDDSNGGLFLTTQNLTVAEGGNVSEINGTTNSLVGPPAPAPNVSPSPLAVAFDRSNGDVYVAEATANRVEVINGTSNVVVSSIAVGAYPNGIAYDAANDAIYVTNTNSDNVSIINATTNVITGSVSVGMFPYGVAVDSSNGDVFVGGGTDNLTVLSGRTNTVVGTTTIGPRPGAMAFDARDGDLYVLTSPAIAFTLNVTIVSGTTYRTVATIPISPMAPGSSDIAYDSSTGYLFVTATTVTRNLTEYLGNVTVIDGASNTVADSIPLGNLSFPTGIAFDSSNGYLYVTDGVLDGYVTVLNGSLFESHGAGPAAFPGLAGYVLGAGIAIAIAAYGGASVHRQRRRQPVGPSDRTGKDGSVEYGSAVVGPPRERDT